MRYERAGASRRPVKNTVMMVQAASVLAANTRLNQRCSARVGRYVARQGTNPRRWVRVPWGITDQSYLNEAAADAGRLQDAINNPSAPGTKDTIADVGRILNDHADDPNYLGAFFAGGGTASVLQTAHVLHAIDGTTDDENVLSPASQQILALYGNALAAAAKNVPSLDPTILGSPPNGDLWSESALFKYGPSGDQWGSKALTIASAAMLDWRTTNPVRPDGDSGSSGGVGLKDPSNAWYASLGLSLDELTYDGNPDPNRLAARLSGIQANDPSIVLMKSLSENPAAARDLFANGTGGADGAHFAHELVNNKWATPGENGNLDDSYWPGQVVAAATGDRISSPAIETESANAAANIFQATAYNYDDDGLQGNTAQLYASLPQNLVDSLAHAAVSYGPDLAAETDRSGAASDKFHTISNDPTGITMVRVGANPMKSMFAALADNPNAAKIFNNGLTDQIAAVAANSSSNPAQAQDLMRQLGDLTGRFSVASQLSGWKQAVANDQAAQASNANDADTAMWFNSIGGFIASVPLGWAEGKIGAKAVTSGDLFKALIWGALPFGTSSGVFPSSSTDNAANHLAAAQPVLFQSQQDLVIPIVKGLLIQHPEWAQQNPAWTMANFDPGNTDSVDALWNIALSRDPTYGLLLGQAKNGFHDGAPTFPDH
jgi:hypothetical protein